MPSGTTSRPRSGFWKTHPALGHSLQNATSQTASGVAHANANSNKVSGTVNADSSGMKVPGKYKGAVCISSSGNITALKPLKAN